MICRFEDRLAGRALDLSGRLTTIEARHPQELDSALAEIDAQRAAGRWIGLMLSYELGEWLLPESTRADRANTVPDPTMPPPLRALVYEHASIEPPWAAPGTDATGTATAPATIDAPVPRMRRADYLKTVRSLREGIGRGDYYQINYTLPLDMHVRGKPQNLYRAIAHRNPCAHAAYIEDGDRTVLSFSPELFVRREGDRLTTRPMKGTAPRSACSEEDRRLGQALRDSKKDRAENLMIVDLLRNDLSRVAQMGSVRTEALFTLEAYPTVWTLTSTISALAPHATLAQILRALFPCGSITGAPKLAAMRVIRAAEIGPRGLYCGSIGWLAPNGDFSLNVAIRTLVVGAGGRATYGVGGGIIYDSDPDLEWEECLWKSRLLATASR